MRAPNLEACGSSASSTGRPKKALQKALEIEPEQYAANHNLMVLYQRTNDPRADAQAKHFDEIKKKRAARELEFLRTIQVRPY